MKIRFELTMPNNNSYNGVDTGIKGGHFIYENVSKDTALKLVGTNHYYNFDDGWGANVKITSEKGTKSNGFRGYDWMVKEILYYGKILLRKERIEMRNNNNYPF